MLEIGLVVSRLQILHMAIHERFQREGIEIAFPQLDVHLRDCTALTVQQTRPRLREGTLRAG